MRLIPFIRACCLIYLSRHRQTAVRAHRDGVRPCANALSHTAHFHSWGEFEIQIRITFVPESGEKAIAFYHHLKLHPWTLSGEPEIPPLDVAMKMGPVHAWQYDEIVFHDPYQNFLTLLTAHPPTPLPKAKKRPVPYHLAHPGSFEAAKGGTPEFNQEMEKEELVRIEEARKAVVAEQNKWHATLIEKEKEKERLQKEVDALVS